MGQMVPAPMHAPEGEAPIIETHGRLPDLPDPQTQGSTAWELESVNPKAHVRAYQARRPVPNVGVTWGCSYGPWSVA